MRQRFLNTLFRWLHLPLDPPAGMGGKEALWVAHPSRKSLRLRWFFWFLAQGSALLFLLAYSFRWSPFDFPFLDLLDEFFEWWTFLGLDSRQWGFPVGALFAWSGFLLGLSTTFLRLWSRIDLQSKWYFFDEQGVGSREGLFTLREKYMAWNKIQTLSLKRSFTQSPWGLATIKIHPAGGDKTTDDGKNMARAIVFHDLDDPETCYRELLRRQKAVRAGQEPEERAVEPPNGERVLRAARRLLEETKALRRSLGEAEAGPEATAELPGQPADHDRETVPAVSEPVPSKLVK